MLLIQKINTNLDDLFFKCANKNNIALLENTNSFIRSKSDSYEVIGNIKRFVQILSLLLLADKEIRNLDVLTEYISSKISLYAKRIF